MMDVIRRDNEQNKYRANSHQGGKYTQAAQTASYRFKGNTLAIQADKKRYSIQGYTKEGDDILLEEDNHLT